MNSFFKVLDEYGSDREIMTVTVLEGGNAGEKAVVSEGEAVYFSDEKGFLKGLGEQLFSLKGKGVETIKETKVYTEYPGHRKKIVICGCGHVSIPIIKLGKMVGFHVTAIDDRGEFVRNAEKAGADRVIERSFKEGLQEAGHDRDTYYVIVTRGHRWDEECLEILCRKKCTYIGVMGSKRRVALVRENLIKNGIKREAVDGIHSPIGLEIGSETPEEIAVSILAEIIKVKNERKEAVIPVDIMTALIGGGHEEPLTGRKILATIVKKSGSAPREEGARMLIAEDRLINTIGGGLMEAKVIERGRKMLSEERPRPEVIKLGLSAPSDSSEGEVCGGEVEVFLEEV